MKWYLTPAKALIQGTSWILRMIDKTPDVGFKNVDSKYKNFPVADRFRVVSYNTHGLPWPFVKNSKEMYLDMYDHLSAYEPEVICLQEAFVKNSDYLVEFLEKDQFYNVVRGPGRWGNLLGSGLVILSKYPIVETGYILFEEHCAARNCLYNKAVLYTRVRIGDRFINIFNTHLQAKDYDFCSVSDIDETQFAQTKKVKSAYSSWAHENGSALFVGDFNFEVGMNAYTNFLNEFPECRNSQEICLNKNVVEASTLRQNEIDHEFFTDSVDHQFFINHKPSNFEIVPVAGQHILAKYVDAVEPSDHVGLMIEYLIRDKAPVI